jgi:dihydroorotate dehydrogenase electron transfer subunit
MTEQKKCGSCGQKFWRGAADVLENVELGRDTYRIRLECPSIAEQILPGQFVMVRPATGTDPLLGRPLAIYDVTERAIDLVYLVVGKMTTLMSGLKAGTPLEVWGPLGNGFAPKATEHLVMVAGGIGQTPFLTLAREYLGLETYGNPAREVPRAKKVTLCYGARSEEYLACVEDFRATGIDVRISTDDGSVGHHGLVTDLIRPVVEESDSACRMVCCGPEPMMASTGRIASELGIACQVSLETPMACGMGICFSCVAKIRGADGQIDYRRTCVDGPVFDASEVEF